MKILLITDLYPIKANEKTTPRTLPNFVKSWEILGHSVDVIKPNLLPNSFLRGKPYYKQGVYGNILNLNYWLPFLQSAPLPKDYDLIISHMPCGTLYADRLKRPFTAGVHVSDLKLLTSPIYQIYFRKRLLTALKNAKTIACRSEMIKKKLLSIHPEFNEKTFTAPSGIDEKLIIKRTPLQDKRNIQVVTCANLIKRKNVDKLINAMQGLEGFCLTVIGDGKELNKLKKIGGSVIFTGRISPEDVHEHMKNADIFVLPSVDETFGLVYLEAMAAGCITVCTKDDGVDGIINDGENGYTTLPIPEEIRKTLLKIKDLNEDEIKTVSYNTHMTAKKYTSENCALNYLQQIDKFL